MLNDVTILLTGTGAPGAPSIIKCLRKNNERNIRIVGVDMSEKASARRMVDTFYVVPPAGDPLFIQSIIDICKKEKVQVIIPLVTRELALFAKEKAVFEDKYGVKVSVMSYDSLIIVNNKASLLSKMKDLGMPTPDFKVVHSVVEIKTAASELGYPQKAICIKGAEGNGSRGVRIVDENRSMYDMLFFDKPSSMYISFHDLILALSERPSIPEMLVMEYLPGQEYGVDALCDNGEILFISGRYNTSVNSSIPQACVTENRIEPIAIAESLINKLQLDGNVNFDFKYDQNGNAQLIEINPRLSATITAYAPSGINYPYLRIKQLIGEELPDCKLKTGIIMQRRYSEVFFDDNGEEIDW